MTVTLHIHDDTGRIHTAYGKTMFQAEDAAYRWCLLEELKVDTSDPAPDRTLYVYDSLGGLRTEIRRRNRKIKTRRT